MSNFMERAIKAASEGFFELCQENSFSSEDILAALKAGCSIAEPNKISWSNNPACSLYVLSYKAHH